MTADVLPRNRHPHLRAAMKSISSFVFLAALCSQIANAASIAITEGVQIEPVTSIATRELWGATSPISKVSGDVIAVYWMIDAEAPIIKNIWSQCGLVMIGNGDVGTVPVTFRVWAKQACNIDMKDSKDVASSGNAEFQSFVNPQTLLKIHVSHELVVTVAGKRIGQIQ